MDKDFVWFLLTLEKIVSGVLLFDCATDFCLRITEVGKVL